MAAIAGVFQRDGSPVEAARLARVADSLALFGPCLAQWRNGPAGFLCRSAPSVPVGLDDCRLVRSAEDGVVLFHGFLHARDELAAAVKAGRPAKDLADGELFALAWDLWKEDAFEKALGAFAAVAWVPGRRRLLASCSAGAMPPPLYYWVGRDSTVVATAPRGVLAWNGNPRRLNDEHLAACLAGDLSDVSGSCWHDVSSLPSGETLTVTTTAHSVRCWHVPGTTSDRAGTASSADYAEATWAMLRRVVGSAARAPDTPAIMMGGLDSAAVALATLDVLAGTAGAAPLLSVTMRPAPGWDKVALSHALTDEWPWVRAVAKMQPRLDARFAHAGETKWDRGLERRFELAEAPPVRYGGFVFVRRCLEIARQEGRRVLLNGAAGNATFSFDGWRRLAELLRAGRVLALWKEARARPRLLWSQALLPLLPAFVQQRFPHRGHGRQARWGERTVLHPALAGRVNLVESANERRRGVLAKSVREAQWVMLNGFGPKSCEMRSNEMASQVVWGVAKRSPLQDRRFVEWCLNLPSAQYMENGVTRLLAKRMLRGRVPDEMLSDRRGVQDVDWHMRLTPDVPAIREEVAEWRRDPAVAERMDVGRLARVLERWSDWASWLRRDDPDWWLARNLTEAVAMGRFIRWAERTQSGPT